MDSSSPRVRSSSTGWVCIALLVELDGVERGRQKSLPGGEKIFVAIYDYDARTDEDLTFRVGDLLFIIDDRFVSPSRLSPMDFVCFSQSDWWLAKHCQSGLKGYIPALYVAPHGGLDVNE